jgi:hypothetical protein
MRHFFVQQAALWRGPFYVGRIWAVHSRLGGANASTPPNRELSGFHYALRVQERGADIPAAANGDLSANLRRQLPSRDKIRQSGRVWRGELELLQPALESFRQEGQFKIRRSQKGGSRFHFIEIGEQQVLRSARASVQFVHNFDRVPAKQ